MIKLKKQFSKMRDNAVKEREKDILSCIKPNPEGKILDIGCNDGVWTNIVAKKMNTNQIFGVEIVEEAAIKAEKNGVTVTRCDISESLPFEDNSFDVIHSNQVIEHLHRTEFFVKEINRILKPGGYAVICTENLSSWHNIFALILGWMPFSSANYSQVKSSIGNPLSIHHNQDMEMPESWQHIRVLSIRGMKDIFELHGFKTKELLGAGYFPLPNFFAKLDKIHSAFMTGKFIKK